jgi:hypothetical protein
MLFFVRVIDGFALIVALSLEELAARIRNRSSAASSSLPVGGMHWLSPKLNFFGTLAGIHMCTGILHAREK